MTTFTTQDLCDAFTDLIICASNKQQVCTNIASVDEYQSNSLIFISDPLSATVLEKLLPSILVTNEDIADSLTINTNKLSIVTTHDVRLAQAKIKTRFADYNAKDNEWDTIHPSAVIHSSAKIGDNTRIGPNVVIGENVNVGSNTVIRANSVIECNVVIGSDCVIHSLVNIGQGCIINNRVILRPGVIIGNEGFGLAPDENGHYHRLPHTGLVRIEDDVQIGSNCNIDRGTYGETVIKRGVKLDALCHIAHNVVIDEDTLLVAQCGIAGSSKIGKNVIISGQAAILDHKTVCDNTVLLHRCGVTEDITEPGAWAGTPAKPMKEYVRNLNPSIKIKRLESKLNKKIDELNEKLAELDTLLKK